MNDEIALPDTLAGAMQKEQALTEAQQRSAMVTLACAALTAADGDAQAAKETLREVLEEIGAMPYEAVSRRARGTVNTIVNYERPGGST